MPVTLDAARLVKRFASSYSVARRTADTFVNGIAVPGSPSTVPIDAVVYQASGRDLQRLPEERRSIATKTIFTTTRLYVGAQVGQGGAESGYDADRITVDGVVFEVQQVQAWPGAPGYYQAIAQAVG